MRGLETVKPLDHWKRFLLPALVLALAFSLFLGVRPASADTSTDLLNAVKSKGWYISDAAKTKLGTQAEATIANAAAQKAKNAPGVIVLADTNTLPKECTGLANNECAKFILSSNPTANFAIIADVTKQPKPQGGLFSVKLSDADVSEVLKSVGDIWSGDIPANIEKLANAATAKILDNNKASASADVAKINQDKKNQEQSSFVTTLIVLAVAVLAIAGAFAFLIITTKSIWRKKVEELQKSANEVSDMVYNLSTEVEYLPDGEKQKAQDTFNQGAMQVTTANDAAAEIKAASTISLVFKWGQYNTKYQDALKKMESIRETLQSVKATVNRDINRA
jgi:hypothetical protein